MEEKKANGRRATPEDLKIYAERRREKMREEAQKLEIPVEVVKLKQDMETKDRRIEEINWKLSKLDKLEEAQERQNQAIQALEEKQEEILDTLEKIYETLEEFLAKERPEASQAARDVAERLEDMEEQIGLIWEAVERLESHTGLSD